jgi:hypothetical protein
MFKKEIVFHNDIFYCNDIDTVTSYAVLFHEVKYRIFFNIP